MLLITSFIYFLLPVIPLTSSIYCAMDYDLDGYPHIITRTGVECQGMACVFLNLSRAMDIGKFNWKGFGSGCDPWHNPICDSLGAMNTCVDLRGKTFNVFDIVLVTEFGESSKLCCCDRADRCLPQDPTGTSDPSKPPAPFSTTSAQNKTSRQIEKRNRELRQKARPDRYKDTTEESKGDVHTAEDVEKVKVMNKTVVGLLCAAVAGIFFLFLGCLFAFCRKECKYR